MRRPRVEKRPTALELLDAMAISEKAAMTNTAEAVAQDMQEKAEDELVQFEPHHLALAPRGGNP